MSNAAEFPKYYTRLDSLPLRNWHELNRSISEGEPEFRWLLKKDIDEPFPKVENIHPLIKAYDSICTQLDSVDISIQRAWAEFVVLNARFNLQRLKDTVKGTSTAKQDKVNIALHDYLTEYAKKYNKIKVKYYKFVEDYEAVYKKITKKSAPDWLHKLKDVSFHIPLQYNHYAKGLPDFVFTNNFIKNYFEVGYLEFEELTSLNSFFYDYFADKNDLNNWFDFRQEYFDFRNLSGNYKYDSNYIKEVLMISDALKMRISPTEVTVAEFEQYLSLMSEKSKKR